MLDDRTKALIRALLYPVQFDQRPEQGIDRVMDQVVKARALHATADDYRTAIEVALDSSEPLSGLLPRTHDEETIRRYLGDLRVSLLGKAA